MAMNPQNMSFGFIIYFFIVTHYLLFLKIFLKNIRLLYRFGTTPSLRTATVAALIANYAYQKNAKDNTNDTAATIISVKKHNDAPFKILLPQHMFFIKIVLLSSIKACKKACFHANFNFF